jgi:hypothetical protein
VKPGRGGDLEQRRPPRVDRHLPVSPQSQTAREQRLAQRAASRLSTIAVMHGAESVAGRPGPVDQIDHMSRLVATRRRPMHPPPATTLIEQLGHERTDAGVPRSG